MDLISNTSNSTPTHDHPNSTTTITTTTATTTQLSRYESQKRRDWNTFGQYLNNHRPPLTLSRCSGAHVLEFLRYLDQFGKTKVHNQPCPFFGHPNPPAPCPCPLRQAWGSLDALVGRLRAAYEELGGGSAESNPFGARAVRLYLREVRDSQAKARGVSYDKKKKKRPRNNINTNNSNNSINNISLPFHHHQLCQGKASGSADTGLAVQYSSLDRNSGGGSSGSSGLNLI